MIQFPGGFTEGIYKMAKSGVPTIMLGIIRSFHDDMRGKDRLTVEMFEHGDSLYCSIL